MSNMSGKQRTHDIHVTREMEAMSCPLCHKLALNESAPYHKWTDCMHKEGYEEFIANQVNYCTFCDDWTRFYGTSGVYACIGKCIDFQKKGYWSKVAVMTEVTDGFSAPDPYKRKKGTRKIPSYEPSRFKKRK